MPKVACFSIPGIECWFWSNDHEPPHFHAKKAGDWEVRVNLLEPAGGGRFQILWEDKPFSRRYRKMLGEKVVRHRIELLSEWEEKVNIQ